MRAWLVACAALALAHAAAPVAPPPLPPHTPHTPHTPRTAHGAHSAHGARKGHQRAPHLDPARLDHIKSQILSKLGLSTRPTPQGAPPRDVVRQILARAADPRPPHHHDDDASMREVIAIAHRDCKSYVPDCCLQATWVRSIGAPLLLLSFLTEPLNRYTKTCTIRFRTTLYGRSAMLKFKVHVYYLLLALLAIFVVYANACKKNRDIDYVDRSGGGGPGKRMKYPYVAPKPLDKAEKRKRKLSRQFWKARRAHTGKIYGKPCTQTMQ